MKKIHLIAAAAALLLSGGVFVKMNQQTNLLLNANLEALSDSVEEIIFWEYSGRRHRDYKKKQLVIDGAYTYDNKGRKLSSIENFECEPYDWDKCDPDEQKTVVRYYTYDD